MYEKLVDTLCAWMSRLWRRFFTTDQYEISPTKLADEFFENMTDELKSAISEGRIKCVELEEGMKYTLLSDAEVELINTLRKLYPEVPDDYLYKLLNRINKDGVIKLK